LTISHHRHGITTAIGGSATIELEEVGKGVTLLVQVQKSKVPA